MKKIAVVHPHLIYPYGATKYIINLVNEIADTTKIKITFITLYTSEPIAKLLSPKIELIELNGASPQSFKYWIMLFLIRNQISKLINKIKPDIILVNVFPANWMIKTKINVPLIWICHEPSAFLYYDHLRAGLSLRMQRGLTPLTILLSRIIDRKIARSFNLLIANSGFTKNEIKRIYGLNAIKIYPGLDPILINAPIKRLPKTNVFGLITSITKEKRIDHLLKAAVVLKRRNIEFTLNIAGDGPYRRHLIRLTKQLCLLENVNYIGQIPQSYLSKFYSEQKFIVYPRYNEPFGLVPIEAMSQGRAVIACTGGGPSETIIHSKTGFLVPPDDHIAMADSICYLLENHDEARELGETGSLIAKKLYSWKNIAQKYLNLMNKLIIK